MKVRILLSSTVRSNRNSNIFNYKIAMSITHIDSLEKIVSLSKARGIIFQSSELYGGLSAVYDYGPRRTALKRNIRQESRNTMTRHNDTTVDEKAAISIHLT